MTNPIIPSERVERAIYFIRGQKVMRDSDLAALYGVETKALNRAIKRNIERFPKDFMFQLTEKEVKSLRYNSGTSKKGRGGRRYLPYAFTEQGVAMLSSVLRSPRAIQVNIAIMRAFVRIREMLSTHKEWVRKLDQMEKKYDVQFKVVFEALRKLMRPQKEERRPIGFDAGDENVS